MKATTAAILGLALSLLLMLSAAQSEPGAPDAAVPSPCTLAACHGQGGYLTPETHPSLPTEAEGVLDDGATFDS